MAPNIIGYVLGGGTDFTIGIAGTKIDSGGRIVIPNNPAVSGYTNISGTVANEYPQQVNSLMVNSGEWTGNTLFTATVSGLYFVSAAHIMNGTGDNSTATNYTYGYVSVVKNGVTYAFNSVQSNDAWTPSLLQTLVYLVVGDTIRIAVNTAPSPSGTSAGMYRANHNNLVITLIG